MTGIQPKEGCWRLTSQSFCTVFVNDSFILPLCSSYGLAREICEASGYFRGQLDEESVQKTSKTKEKFSEDGIRHEQLQRSIPERHQRTPHPYQRRPAVRGSWLSTEVVEACSEFDWLLLRSYKGIFVVARSLVISPMENDAILRFMP